jgi:PAS domain S-box-containing protein
MAPNQLSNGGAFNSSANLVYWSQVVLSQSGSIGLAPCSYSSFGDLRSCGLDDLRCPVRHDCHHSPTAPLDSTFPAVALFITRCQDNMEGTIVMRRTAVPSAYRNSSGARKKRKGAPQKRPARSNGGTPLVAKSASTRALHRLTELLARVEPSSGATFVLAHHLKGKYRKKLLALLGKASPQEAAEMAAVRKELSGARSEVKRFREEAHALQNDVDMLMEHLPFPVLLLDREMKIRWCSVAVQDILDVSSHESGKRISQLNIRTDKHDVATMVAEVLKTGVPRQCDVIGTNGRLYVMDVLPAGTPEVQAVILTFADAETRRRGLRDMEVQRTKEKRHLEIATGLVAELDAQQKVVRMNRKGMETLGYTYTEMPGKDWPTDVIAPHGREAWLEAVGHLMGGEREYSGSFEASVVTAAGEERVCLWQCAAIHNADGEPAGLLCSGQDVTERRALEIALRQSEERIHLMMDNAKEDEFFIMDPDGYIVSWIARSRDDRTYRAEDVLGEHFSRFYPADDYQAGKPMRVLEKAEREGRYEAEEARVRKDNSVSGAYVIVTAIRDNANTLLGFSNITRYLPQSLREGRGLEIPEWHFSDVM